MRVTRFGCGKNAHTFDDASALCHELNNELCQTDSSAFSPTGSFFGCSTNLLSKSTTALCGSISKTPYPVSAVYAYHGRGILVIRFFSAVFCEILVV